MRVDSIDPCGGWMSETRIGASSGLTGGGPQRNRSAPAARGILAVLLLVILGAGACALLQGWVSTSAAADGPGPIKYITYRKFDVSLSHAGEPLDIEVVIGCGAEQRQGLAEGKVIRMIAAPYIYGVRT